MRENTTWSLPAMYIKTEVENVINRLCIRPCIYWSITVNHRLIGFPISGMYGIHVKFNDDHIPESPFRVGIAPDGGSARQVTVHALKDRGLAVSRDIRLSFCTKNPH